MIKIINFPNAKEVHQTKKKEKVIPIASCGFPECDLTKHNKPKECKENPDIRFVNGGYCTDVWCRRINKIIGRF